MITIRQMERDWVGRKYEKLFDALVEHRPEGSFPFDLTDGRAVPAAAMALIRLDELSQTHVPHYTRLVRTLLAAQNINDGGWGDPLVTALCLRALMAGRGHGAAIDAGLHYLADLQKTEGIWPSAPIRRLPADPAVSAFVLYQLADQCAFRDAVRFADAVEWFETHQSSLDADARRWWDYASLRCQVRPPAYKSFTLPTPHDGALSLS
jgi:hypothetical protein